MHADVVIAGATIMTVDSARARAEAVAIRDGRVVAVGTRPEVDELRGRRTREIALDGGAVLPGFQDAHNHACFAGLYRLTCDLHDLYTREEYLHTVAAYAAAHKGAEWITGGGWSMTAFPRGTPRREDLDRVVPDRPVYLVNADLHGAWVNSRALAFAAIGRDTPDPPGGRISGIPTVRRPARSTSGPVTSSRIGSRRRRRICGAGRSWKRSGTCYRSA